MLARLLVRGLFGDIWSLKERCKVAKGVSARALRFIYHYYQYEHGSAISYAAEFKSAPLFPRGMKQIVVGEDASIGANCTILHQVTIDSDTNRASTTVGAPIIGDNCYLYPGVKIIGNIQIGNNVTIKANVAVETDIPDNSIVYSMTKQEIIPR